MEEAPLFFVVDDQGEQKSKIKKKNLKYITKPNDKVTKTIFFENYKLNAQIGINMTTKNNEVVNYIKVIQSEEVPRLNYYDFLVFCAIANLYEKENYIVTYKSILETMTGGYISKISELQFNSISESIQKMMGTVIIQNLTEEIEKHNRHFSESIQKDNLINVKVLESSDYSIRGQEVKGVIEILALPALYKNAKIRKQVHQIDNEVLATPLKKSYENIIITEYLISRISLIEQNGKLKNVNSITLDKLYKLVGANTRRLQFSRRQNITEILDYWKNINFIYDYKYVPDPNTKRLQFVIILEES